MAGHQHLLCATLLGLLFKGIFLAGNSVPDPGITLKLDENHVTLYCDIALDNENVTWKKDGHGLAEQAKDLHVGTALDDPQGSYECSAGQKNGSLQVFFRMCQNCIQVDFATLSGLLVASIVTTVFLALAVSKIAAQEPGRLSRASDKQTLLANDQLYQPLRERNNGQYSQIGIAKPRHR